MFKRPNDKQYVDDRCGLILPWYTKPALDHLISLDTKDYNVYEWGGGCSTVWYAHNCKSVTTLESDDKWAKEIEDYLVASNYDNYKINTISVPASANKPHPNMDLYLDHIALTNTKYDLIIVDGSYRNDALLISINHVKNGGYIIFDNYLQDTSGYKDLPNAHIVNEFFAPLVYEQPDFGDWKTAIWQIH